MRPARRGGPEARATFFYRIDDQFSSHVHRERERLHYKMVAVPVDN